MPNPPAARSVARGHASRALVVVGACLFSSLVPPHPAHAQLGADKMTVWLHAVRSHTPGASDSELTQISEWPLPDLQDVLAQLGRSGAGDRQLVQRALLLHTDIAVLRRRSDGYALPPASGTQYLVEDGLGIGRSDATFHWEIGRQLIYRLLGTPSPGRPTLADLARTRDGPLLQGPVSHAAPELDVARTWFHATAAILQSWGEYPELALQIEAGKRVLGADATLLLHEGTMHQTFAGPGMQSFLERQQLRSIAPSASEERGKAESLFRAALAREPGLHEARIRLGHVLADRDRHPAAVAELRRALQDSLSPQLEYYASLLLGREYQALGQAEEARLALERARALWPGAQSPRLGLSQLAMARGDLAEARGLLTRGLGPIPEAAGDDPWTRIARMHEPSGDVLLARMREAFAR